MMRLSAGVGVAETGITSAALRRQRRSKSSSARRYTVPETLKAPTANVHAPSKSNPRIVETVAEVLDDIRTNGDEAVRKYSQVFDGWSPETFRLDEAAVAAIVSSLPTTVIDDLEFVQRQVRNFA